MYACSVTRPSFIFALTVALSQKAERTNAPCILLGAVMPRQSGVLKQTLCIPGATVLLTGIVVQFVLPFPICVLAVSDDESFPS